MENHTNRIVKNGVPHSSREYYGDVPIHISRDGNMSVDLYDLVMNVDVMNSIRMVAAIPVASDASSEPQTHIVDVVGQIPLGDPKLQAEMDAIDRAGSRP